MPEGDSIHRAATRMRPVLLGKKIEEGLTTKAIIPVSRLIDREVTEIDTHGKYLFIRFGTFGSIRIHLGMDGRYFYRRLAPPFPPTQPVHLLALRAGKAWMCCRAPKILDWDAPLVREQEVRGLSGQDLLKEHDSNVIAQEMQRLGDLPIASALLRQNIAAGIGNVYKSEILFLERVHPETATGDLSLEKLKAMVDRAAWLLQRNVVSYTRDRRTTRFGMGPKLSVYGRGDEPCLKCGARIVRMVDREMARSTYFCPSCQKRRASV